VYIRIAQQQLAAADAGSVYSSLIFQQQQQPQQLQQAV